MSSNREAIMARIEAILKTVDGFSNAYRNTLEINDKLLPAASVLEGSENALESTFTRKRPPHGPNIIYASVQIGIMVQKDPATLGTELNAFRESVIQALQTDEMLLSLIHDEDIRYEGMDTALGAGRSMAGEMVLQFTIAYVQR